MRRGQPCGPILLHVRSPARCRSGDQQSAKCPSRQRMLSSIAAATTRWTARSRDKAGGECTLQKMYVDWDATAGTQFDKVHKPKVVDLRTDHRGPPRCRARASQQLLHPRLRRGGGSEPTHHGQARRPRDPDHRAGTGARQPLLAQHRGCLSGARGAHQKTSASPCGSGSCTPRQSVCPAAPPVQHGDPSQPRRSLWRDSGCVRARTRRSTSSLMCDEGASPIRRSATATLGSARSVGPHLPGQLAASMLGRPPAAERLKRVDKLSQGSAAATIGLVFSAQAQNEALYGLRQIASRSSKRRRGAHLRHRQKDDRTAPTKSCAAPIRTPTPRGRASSLGPERGDFAAPGRPCRVSSSGVGWSVRSCRSADIAAGSGGAVDSLDTICQAVHDTRLGGRAQVQLPGGGAGRGRWHLHHRQNPGSGRAGGRATAGGSHRTWSLVSQLWPQGGPVSAQKWQTPARQAFLVRWSDRCRWRQAASRRGAGQPVRPGPTGDGAFARAAAVCQLTRVAADPPTTHDKKLLSGLRIKTMLFEFRCPYRRSRRAHQGRPARPSCSVMPLACSAPGRAPAVGDDAGPPGTRTAPTSARNLKLWGILHFVADALK